MEAKDIKKVILDLDMECKYPVDDIVKFILSSDRYADFDWVEEESQSVKDKARDEHLRAQFLRFVKRNNISNSLQDLLMSKNASSMRVYLKLIQNEMEVQLSDLVERKISQRVDTRYNISIDRLKKVAKAYDLELAYPIKQIRHFMVNEMMGQSPFKHSDKMHFKQGSMVVIMFRRFVDENSFDGQFARDYLNDDVAPEALTPILEYLIERNANKESIGAFFNIIQRVMDDNANYSQYRNLDVDLEEKAQIYDNMPLPRDEMDEVIEF